MQNDQEKFDPRSPALKAHDLLAGVATQLGYDDDPKLLMALKQIQSRRHDVSFIQKIVSQTMQWLNRTPEMQMQFRDQNPIQPYPRKDIDGPVLLGKIYNPLVAQPLKWGLELNELNQNLMIFGRAGAGKTVILLTLALRLLQQNIPFLVFDFKKDYRSLIRASQALLVFSWRTFKFNPLAPPQGCDPTSWQQVVSDTLFESLFNETPTAAKFAFLDVLQNEYERVRLEEGDKRYPTLIEIAERIEKIVTGQVKGFASADRLRPVALRLRPLVQILNTMFDCREGYSIDELLKRPLALELDGLSIELQSLIVQLLFHWIFQYRINNAQRGQFRHALFCDEAKMIFSQEKASGSSGISRFVSTAREFGQGLILAEQMPTTLGHAVLANLYTMIGLNLSATADIQKMGQAIGLNAVQREILNKLPQGFGIVKMAGRYSDPFLVEFPDCPLDKRISESEVAQRMTPILTGLTWTACPNRQNATTSTETKAGAKPAQNVTKQEPADPTTSKEKNADIDLDERELNFLQDVKNRPFVALTKRYTDLKITRHMGTKISRRLIELGLCEEIAIQTGRRGRSEKFLKFTAICETKFGKQNYGPGKGGFEHVYHQQRLAHHFKAQGWKTKIEAFRNGKAVDLELEKDGEQIAIEVAMNPLNEQSNIEKDIAAGWERIIILCGDESIRERVEADWNSIQNCYPTAQVTIELIRDLKI